MTPFPDAGFCSWSQQGRINDHASSETHKDSMSKGRIGRHPKTMVV